jgi:hypothetical protein
MYHGVSNLVKPFFAHFEPMDKGHKVDKPSPLAYI